MKTQDFLFWLKGWMARHPLNTPPESLQTSYIEEVMARVRAISARSLGWQWVLVPRPVLAVSTALAAVLVVVLLANRAPNQLAQRVEHDGQLLSELGALEELSTDDLEDEAQMVDQLMLADAESAGDDEAWIEQTLELLGDLDEGPDMGSGDTAPEEWLDDLEWLDESEFASS